MDNSLHPKVTDFGIAIIINSEKSETNIKTNVIKGTICFMAPEIIEKLDYTKACDVYSYGIIVYEIMTNLVPYGDKSPYLIMTFSVISIGNYTFKGCSSLTQVLFATPSSVTEIGMYSAHNFRCPNEYN